jgi:hypothetical protein
VPVPQRQLPRGDEIFLDHVGHFVRDAEAASRALERAGFLPTPVSIQVNPDVAVDAPGRLTGTGNITAMLARGYIEVLFKTADTPLGQEFDAALARYPGIHLAAFSVADAAGAHCRLEAAGFSLRPLIEMSRPVETENGADTAAFTIVRPLPGEMPEGRIQMLTHRTEQAVWQPRWLTHPNGVLGLVDLVIVTVDPAAAASRFARFTGHPTETCRVGQIVRLDRGAVVLVSAAAFARLLPGCAIPSLPFNGTYGLAVRALDHTEAFLRTSGESVQRRNGALVVNFPEELGSGAWVFAEHASDLPWRT